MSHWHFWGNKIFHFKQLRPETQPVGRDTLAQPAVNTYNRINADGDELLFGGLPLIAAGNICCLTQIASGTQLPVVHTVELLDRATGGPKPAALG